MSRSGCWKETPRAWRGWCRGSRELQHPLLTAATRTAFPASPANPSFHSSSFPNQVSSQLIFSNQKIQKPCILRHIQVPYFSPEETVLVMFSNYSNPHSCVKSIPFQSFRNNSFTGSSPPRTFCLNVTFTYNRSLLFHTIVHLELGLNSISLSLSNSDQWTGKRRSVVSQPLPTFTTSCVRVLSSLQICPQLTGFLPFPRHSAKQFLFCQCEPFPSTLPDWSEVVHSHLAPW